MDLSVLDVFKIGIGPSSSHTMGPMNAARRFVELVDQQGLLARVTAVRVQLFGSLALTGKGHCTDRAVLLGLEGLSPDTMDPAAVEPTLERIRGTQKLRVLGKHEIEFIEKRDVLWHVSKVLPGHSNGIKVAAFAGEQEVLSEEYYSDRRRVRCYRR